MENLIQFKHWFYEPEGYLMLMILAGVVGWVAGKIVGDPFRGTASGFLIVLAYLVVILFFSPFENSMGTYSCGPAKACEVNFLVFSSLWDSPSIIDADGVRRETDFSIVQFLKMLALIGLFNMWFCFGFNERAERIFFIRDSDAYGLGGIGSFRQDPDNSYQKFIRNVSNPISPLHPLTPGWNFLIMVVSLFSAVFVSFFR